MLVPVTRDVFRWATPDPADNWMMVGHLVIKKEEIALVDPPLVPFLPEAIHNIGGSASVILTTLDHMRASRYFASEHGFKVFVPRQIETTNFDPVEAKKQLEFNEFVEYDETDALPCGLKAIRARPFTGHSRPRYDEMALLTEGGELIAGDIAAGTKDGKFRVGPELFNPNPRKIEVMACFEILANIIRSHGAKTLLSSHWNDIESSLQDAVNEKGRELSDSL